MTGNLFLTISGKKIVVKLNKFNVGFWYSTDLRCNFDVESHDYGAALIVALQFPTMESG